MIDKNRFLFVCTEDEIDTKFTIEYGLLVDGISFSGADFQAEVSNIAEEVIEQMKTEFNDRDISIAIKKY